MCCRHHRQRLALGQEAGTNSTYHLPFLGNHHRQRHCHFNHKDRAKIPRHVSPPRFILLGLDRHLDMDLHFNDRSTCKASYCLRSDQLALQHPQYLDIVPLQERGSTIPPRLCRRSRCSGRVGLIRRRYLVVPTTTE